jgi:hypothetical protein
MAKPPAADESRRTQLLEVVGPIIQSLTRELNDDAPGATITRAVNILDHYGVPPRDAAPLIYQARATLKQRHQVKRKAPYLLRLLEELAKNHTPSHPGKGNQNARTHGWWSRVQPLSNDELFATVRELALNADYRGLRELARATMYVRRDRTLSRSIRKLARQLERRNVLRAANLIDQVRSRLPQPELDELIGTDWEELSSREETL